MFEFSLDLFMVLVICISFITIGIVLHIVSRKDLIKWYLKFRSPNEKVDKVIDDKFNVLKAKWFKYNKLRISLSFQLYILLSGLALSLSMFLDGYFNWLNWWSNWLIASIVYFIIISFAYVRLYNNTISAIAMPVIADTEEQQYRIVFREKSAKLAGIKRASLFIFLLQYIPILIVIAYIKAHFPHISLTQIHFFIIFTQQCQYFTM